MRIPPPWRFGDMIWPLLLVGGVLLALATVGIAILVRLLSPS
jgi:hypothetical protein